MDDTISRQQAIDALRNYLVGKNIHCDGTLMARLIENEVVNKLPSVPPDTYWKEQCQSYEQTINKLRESLSTQPEIIRCKDCKHWIPYDWMFSEVWRSKNMADYPEDEMGCKWCDMSMKANDFCSRAERREDE